MRQTIIHMTLAISTMLLLLFGMAIWEVGIQVSKFGNYQKTVNEVVARYGGLTPPAMTEINAHSKQYGDNRFSIVSDEMGVKKSYGETISYKIKQDYEVNIIISKKITKYTEGSTISEVR